MQSVLLEVSPVLQPYLVALVPDIVHLSAKLQDGLFVGLGSRPSSVYQPR